MTFCLTTERLQLREWRDEDIAPFSLMNADPEVMRYFPRVMSAQQTEQSVERFRDHQGEHGFAFWPAVLKQTGEFIGFIGIQNAPENVPCAPAVEIGWRLRKEYWGQGLAPEGARAVLAYAFSALQLPELVSFTAKINEPSQRVMQKIGMKRDHEGGFLHPSVERSSALEEHVLYRLKAEGVSPS